MTTNTVARPRYATPWSPERLTNGPKVAAIAREMGFELMPWQQQVVNTACEMVPGPTGELVPAFRRVIVTVPRQSGKTTLLLALFVNRLLQPGRHDVVYGAQDRQSARAKWEEHVHMFQSSPLARTHRHTLTRVNGSEKLRIDANRSTWSITANTEKAGHGSTPALVCLDEAFALVDNRLEQAYVPAMKNVPEGQFWIVSTAGTAASLYLAEQVELGRAAALAGQTTGVAYFEWSAPDDADPADENVWRECMPALGHTRETIDQLRADFASLPLGEWRRAYLNQWTRTDERVIPSHVWDRAGRGPLIISRPIVLAVDIAPDRSAASITSAGAVDPDGTAGVILEYHAPGVDGLVPELLRLCRQLRPVSVVLDSRGPVTSHTEELRARLPCPIDTTSTAQFTGACARFLDELVAGTVVHERCDPLDVAVSSAARRPIGDAWAWTRARSSGDITPLVAASIALAAHRDHQRRRPTIA
jgi:phage terminase large subunit-like protein